MTHIPFTVFRVIHASLVRSIKNEKTVEVSIKPYSRPLKDPVFPSSCQEHGNSNGARVKANARRDERRQRDNIKTSGGSKKN